MFHRKLWTSSNTERLRDIMDAMLKQYHELKKKHPDAILLFRCGDFYETYEDDAADCAKILGITLTKRTDDGTRMAGFPYHALDTYLPKLIRAGRRVAICDFENPNLRTTVKRGEQNYKINQNIKNQKSVMETKSLKAADLIGKTIVVGDNIATINIKSAENDKLQGEFKKGDAAPMAMPLTLKQLKDMLDAGIWKIAGETKTEKTDGPDIPEKPKAEKPKTEKPKAEKPKAEKPKATKPKAKKTDAPKSEEPKTEPKSEEPKTEPKTKKYVYETYVNKKAKTCARIKGLSSDEPAYTSAIDLHASASYETKKGKKSYYIIFGPRYKDAAREVCEALNAGKSFEVCKTIIEKTTADRAAKREEWKRQAEERKAKGDGAAATTGYSAADVAAMLKRVMAGEDIPEDIKKEMAA